MNSGDKLTVDIHDGAAGLTVIVHDLTTGQTGSMTASAANGFAQVLYEPTSATCHQAPYTFRPMYATSSEHTRVPWAAHTLQRRLLRRDRPLRVLLGRLRGGRRLPRQQRGRARRRRRRLLQRGLLAARPDRRLHRHRQRLRRGLVPAGVAGNGSEPRPGQEVPPDRDHVHEPALQRDAELQPGRVRGRPAADRGGRLRRQLQPVHRRELREPAAGLELLPDLHDRDVDADPEPTGTASGSSAGPTSRARRTRSAGTRRRSSGRCCSASTRTRPGGSAPDEQLPQRPELESLPGLTRAVSA